MLWTSLMPVNGTEIKLTAKSKANKTDHLINPCPKITDKVIFFESLCSACSDVLCMQCNQRIENTKLSIWMRYTWITLGKIIRIFCCCRWISIRFYSNETRKGNRIKTKILNFHEVHQCNMHRKLKRSKTLARVM